MLEMLVWFFVGFLSMNFEIVPQAITLYPADVQRFTVQGSPPSSGWRTLTDGTIQSDLSLLYTGSGGLLRGNGLHQLESGIGRVTLTVDVQSLPTTGGLLAGYILDAGSGAQLWFEASPTQILVKKLPTLTTLATVSHTLAAGDTLALEMAGDRWRFYLNGTEEAGFTPASANRYPGVYKFEVTPPVSSGTAHLLAPSLSGGKWNVASATWTVTGGSASPSSGSIPYIDYTASTAPGVYTVYAQTESSLQSYTATVIIPPLSILGETSVTLQPGTKYTFKTNYDSAQTRLVTWSVVSGSGSFSNGEFTAPSAPGTTIVKAVYGNQEARITITIPAVMTIETSGGEDVTAATLGEVLTLSTNMSGTINWTASVGTLSSSTGSSVTWTAPNQSQLVALITATNGTYTVTAEIPALKEFPYRPNRPLKWDRKKTVLISRSEDRRRAARVKDFNNEAYEAFELTFVNRTLSELSAVKTFWDDHHPQKRFIFTDAHRSVRKVVYFDSDISHDAAATCATTYSLRIIEG